jgi:hypothetical protein
LLRSDLNIKFPEASEEAVLTMLEEADDNSDRRLDFQEFKVLAFDLSTGALNIQAPAFSEEEAPPEFLSRQVFFKSVSVCAGSAICLSQALHLSDHTLGLLNNLTI